VPNYFDLSSSDLVETWDPGTITTNNGWPATGSIVGYLGNYTTASPTGTDPRSLTTQALGDVNVVANQTSGNPSSGGVIEVTVGGNTMIGLNGSGTADAPSLVFYLDSTGREQVTLSFDAIDADTSADDAVQQLNIQYRTSPTGPWINVDGGYFADVSAPNATLTTAISVTLPPEANNSSTLEVRVMTTNAGGNDEFIGIDNIHIVSQPLDVTGGVPGILSIGDASVTEGNAGTTDITFTVTRASGDDGEVSASWSVVHGTTNATDFAGATSGTVTFADGETSRTITIQVAGDLTVEPNEAFTVQLSNPQGGVTIGDGSGAGTILTDDLPSIANVWINEFHYDPSSVPETGEFIEVAGVAGVDLSGYKLVLYNGSNGSSYGTLSLSGTLADTASGFGFASIAAPGLQNGSPDGIALVDGFGRVVQFLSYEGVMTATNGPAAGMTSTDIIRFEDQATPGTSLQLAGTGSTYGDFHWTFGNPNTTGAANAGQSFLSGTDQGQIRVDNGQIVEGDSGQASLTFTLHRSGGFATDATVEYSLGFGTADAGDLPAGTPLAGTVTFAAGEFTQTITVPIAGDIVPEYNEWLYVQLGAVTGNAVVVDGQAIGTIVNDDRLPLTIMEIQGESHWSEFVGQPIVTEGIVTGVAANGFYIQDPDGDGNANTSDGIFVFTGTVPAVAVGDAVSVAGKVEEFGSDLPVTEIRVGTEAGAGISVLSHGNDLPEAVFIGAGGLMPPTEYIDSDGLTVFNPSVDGADFWESLEGMRVSIDAPQVVVDSNAFGETYVVASHGQGATGLNGSGGMTLGATDSNPEVIQIDDDLIGSSGYLPNHTVGDQLGTVTGIVNYGFTHYELQLTEAPTVTADVTLQPETVSFTGDANFITVATFNVENLGPEDEKYDELAVQIVDGLGSPDVIALQEVQDNDGPGNGTDWSADQNVQNLIDAIYAESGITYEYVEIVPTASTGGEGGGHIRNGYLYRVDRVDFVEGSLQTLSDPSYSNSREPLLATWSFQGEEITTINVHFYARSGGDPAWGATQPPEISGDDRRTDQAAVVGQWINEHLADDPSLNIAVLGDWNGFYWEEAQTQLTDAGLVNLQVALLPPEERYSYFFDGNAQLFDNILVTGGLLNGAMIDGVHFNAYFGAAQTSDHDPQVAAFLLGTRPTDVVISNASVNENLPAGSVVGTVSATDAPTDHLTYSLVDNGGGRFAIDAATGVITTTAALDHESSASADVVVRVMDAAGQSTDQAFTITVGNVNEAPVAGADSASVNEDAATGNLWDQLLDNDSDPDAGDALTITAVGTAGTLGSLIFDAATHTLQYVADHDSFDALATGATATDSFTYTVTDAGGLTRTATVTMTVTGIADGVVRNGANGNETLVGTGGEDRLYGNNGNDRLEGGAGHDVLDGGRGNDVLLGGIGNDMFVFGASAGSDTVLDFDSAHDTIRLEGGQFLAGSHTADVNYDGLTDLVLDLRQGSVTLLGVDSIDDVRIEGDAHSASWSMKLSLLNLNVHDQIV